jgi:N-acetylornithine carbamoyltransferase
MRTGMIGKHLLATEEWTDEELHTLLYVAKELKMRYALDLPTDILKNKTVFMLFFEESTRTRNAFECGITQLGGHANYLTPEGTQVGHGETPQETVEVLGRMGHGIGVRNTLVGGHKWMRALTEHAKIPVMNMQCDLWHPTQALADIMTIQEKFNNELRGRKFVISWTCAGEYMRPLSMANSLVALMPRFGLDVVLAHPKGFELEDYFINSARKAAEEHNTKFDIVYDMEEAFTDAHIIYAKGWGPITTVGDDAVRGVQMINEHPEWFVDQRKMDLGAKDAIYMHCMPADRDVEVSSEVMDGPQSVIYDEAENRLHTIKALMALTMGNTTRRG